MAVNVNHIIRHAGLNLRLAGKDSGMEVQQDAGRWMELLFEKLEPALDTMAGEGLWLSLDKLDIEVRVSGNRWQEEALEKVTAKIVEAISLHASHAIAETHFNTASPALHFAEIFLFYLQYGYLPWNTGAEVKSAWQEHVKQLFTQRETRFAAKLMILLEQIPPATQRLLAAVPLPVFVTWMSDHAADFEPGKQQLITDIKALLTLQNEWPVFTLKKETETLLLNLLVNNEMEMPDTQVSLLFGDNARSINALAKALKEWKPSSPMFLRLKEKLVERKRKVIIPEKLSQKVSGEKPAGKTI